MGDDESGKPDFEFEGFDDPSYTQVPDVVFDRLMVHLTESELKVLLYIIRRTYGFKKRSDNISIKQLVEGITTRDGRRLDYGAGVSKASAVRGTKGLVDKKIILAVRNRASDNADIPTTYQLRRKVSEVVEPVSEYETPPVFTFDTQGSLNLEQARGSNLNTQETVEQQTVKQETDRIVDISKGRSRKISYPQTRVDLQPYAEDFAREFGDEAPMSSTLSQMVNLCDQSGLDVDDFIDVLLAARSKTKEFSGSVNRASSDGRQGRKNRMPYFFRVVENMLNEDDENRVSRPGTSSGE